MLFDLYLWVYVPISAVRAENLFLRRQLALFAERKVKARRADDGTRLVLVLLSRLFAWKDALVIVKPETMIGWHRKGFRFLWRWKSKRQGRPRIPVELQKLIAQMVEQNVTWGEERIAAEILLKLGIRVSPRTVRRYMPKGTGTGCRLTAGQDLKDGIQRRPDNFGSDKSPMLITAGGCSNVNRGVSKSELTAFLTVVYHVAKEGKREWRPGPDYSFSPNAPLRTGEHFTKETNHEAKH